MDVHGAGAQRADIKNGDPSKFPQGRGPQGDVMRIYNLVRCVRRGMAKPRATGPKVEMKYVRQDFERANMQLGNADGPPRGGRGEGPTSGSDWVRRLDRDGDDKVSRREFDGPAEHFGLFDRNRNGAITAVVSRWDGTFVFAAKPEFEQIAQNQFASHERWTQTVG